MCVLLFQSQGKARRSGKARRKYSLMCRNYDFGQMVQEDTYSAAPGFSRSVRQFVDQIDDSHQGTKEQGQDQTNLRIISLRLSEFV